MNFRLWFPQLDIYDSARRIGALLGQNRAEWPVVERLYILDFYLANPPLLHFTHMPETVRKEFRTLNVPRPEKAFISYPAPPILFAKMGAVQKEAVRTLLGKGLVNRSLFEQSGQTIPTVEGSDVFAAMAENMTSEAEKRVLRFLTNSFDTIGMNQAGGLRTATGLWRVGL